MPLITTANVACGFHGGDPVTMGRTVALAKGTAWRWGRTPATRTSSASAAGAWS